MLFVEIDQRLRRVFVDIVIFGRRRIFMPHSIVGDLYAQNKIRSGGVELPQFIAGSTRLGQKFAT